jgi:hypothetical protein
MKKIVFTLILLTLGLSMTYSQEFSKNSIFVGLSPIGRWENSTREGSGINWTIGYQKNIWKNKIRFVPSLSFGNYSSKGIDDATELNANSTTLKTSLNFDILKIKSFSVFIGSGLAVNYSSGLSRYSGYFDNTNFAVNGLLGLKINPEHKRFNYELLLADFSSKSDFLELSLLKFRLVMKLK